MLEDYEISPEAYAENLLCLFERVPYFLQEVSKHI